MFMKSYAKRIEEKTLNWFFSKQVADRSNVYTGKKSRRNILREKSIKKSRSRFFLLQHLFFNHLMVALMMLWLKNEHYFYENVKANQHLRRTEKQMMQTRSWARGEWNSIVANENCRNFLVKYSRTDGHDASVLKYGTCVTSFSKDTIALIECSTTITFWK